MATDDKKPGSGLDDLKARLGLDSMLAKPRRAEPPKEAAPKPAVGQQTPPGVAPNLGLHEGQTMLVGDDAPDPSRPIPVHADHAGVETRVLPPKPTRPEEASGEYAFAVSRAEEPEVGEGDPTPVESGVYDDVDPHIRQGLPKSAQVALLVITIGLVLGALLVGFSFGQVMRRRVIHNQVIRAAQDLLPRVEQIANDITEFGDRLASFPVAYSAELHQLFWTPMVAADLHSDPVGISDARVLMSTGLDITDQLLRYSLDTQMLNELVSMHIRRSEPEIPIIQRIQSGADELIQYAIWYDWNAVTSRYRTYYDTYMALNPPEGEEPNGDDPDNDDPEDPEVPLELLFEPTPGTVVTYENLDVRPFGEGEGMEFVLDVFYGGRSLPIEIYNFLAIERDQLVSNPHEETAETRYEDRVRQIRSQLQDVLHRQGNLVEALRAESRREQQSTF